MENWPVLITFNYAHEAHQVKGYLESCGIETIMRDEIAAQVISYLPAAIGGVKLLVRESEYDQGIQLLKEGGYLAKEEGAPESKVEIVPLTKASNKKVCPFCSSDNIAAFNKSGALGAVLLAILNLIFIFGTIVPRSRSSYKCFDCGKEWKYKKA